MTTGPRPGRGRALLARTARLDLLLQARHGTWAAVLAVAVAWVVLVRLVPAADRPAVLGLVVYGDVAAIGVVFAGAHVLADRRSGTLAAMGAVGMPAGVYVGAGVTTLTAAGVVATVTVVGGAGMWSATGLAAVAAVGLSLVTLPLAVVVAARTRQVTHYLVAVQLLLVPVALPLLAATGWVSWDVADVVPTAGPLRLLLAAVQGTALGGRDLAASAWTAVAAGAGLRAAVGACERRLLHEDLPAPEDRPAHDDVRRHADVSPAGGPLRALLAADLRGAARDPVLRLIAVAPLVVAIVARVAVPVLTAAARQRLGWDLALHRPTMLALVLLVVPMLLGSIAGLLTLEDRETGVLSALVVSPVGRGPLLARRPATAAVASAVALVVTVPLSGLADPGLAALVPAIVLAAATACVWALALPAVARDRLGGLAAGKALALPALAPLLAAALDGAARAALRLTPTWWPAEAVRAAWSQRAVVPTFVVGLAVIAGLCAVLLTTASRRLDGA